MNDDTDDRIDTGTDDVEGHRRVFAREATSPQDTEGSGFRMVAEQPDDDTEGHASRTARAARTGH